MEKGVNTKMNVIKHTGRASSMPKGLLTGLICALIITLAGTTATAKLVEHQHLALEKTGYAVMLIIIAASWFGSWISNKMIRHQKIKVCMLSAICVYLLLLAITALFFGGQYDGAGETALLIFCGSMLPLFLKLPGKTERKRSKIKMHNR